VSVDTVHEAATWQVKYAVEKFHGEVTEEQILAGEVTPYEVLEREGNMLVYGGVSNLWQCLIGNGTGTSAQTLTFFNNSNAHLAVGDSATAAAATQTDLVAATNKLRRPMEATYPTHTDGTVVGAATITFRSVFGTSDANWVWNEWGIFNGSSGGRMLNRKVDSLGTKTSAATWTFTVTITLS
jgi:hypothetical protein